MQIHKLFGLDLEGANLVMASACETALNRIQGGDDLVGWKVDDPATARLMAHFYRNWRERGMSKPQALRQAQLALKQMPQYRHPYH